MYVHRVFSYITSYFHCPVLWKQNDRPTQIEDIKCPACRSLLPPWYQHEGIWTFVCIVVWSEEPRKCIQNMKLSIFHNAQKEYVACYSYSPLSRLLFLQPPGTEMSSKRVWCTSLSPSFVNEGLYRDLTDEIIGDLMSPSYRKKRRPYDQVNWWHLRGRSSR